MTVIMTLCPQTNEPVLTDATELFKEHHDIIREVFIWTRCMDADGNYLTEPEHVLLKDITDEHLIALIEWTKEGYSDNIKQTFINEFNFRGLEK